MTAGLAARLAYRDDAFSRSVQAAYWTLASANQPPGRRITQRIVRACANGATPAGPDDLAVLLYGIQWLQLRDDAWALCLKVIGSPGRRLELQRLWTELIRCSAGLEAAAPASLLAFCAWQGGDEEFALAALDRAQEARPEYTMAAILRGLVESSHPAREVAQALTEQASAVTEPGGAVQAVLDVIAPLTEAPPGCQPVRWPVLAYHENGKALLPQDWQLHQLAVSLVAAVRGAGEAP